MWTVLERERNSLSAFRFLKWLDHNSKFQKDFKYAALIMLSKWQFEWCWLSGTLHKAFLFIKKNILNKKRKISHNCPPPPRTYFLENLKRKGFLLFSFFPYCSFFNTLLSHTTYIKSDAGQNCCGKIQHGLKRDEGDVIVLDKDYRYPQWHVFLYQSEEFENTGYLLGAFILSLLAACKKND